MELGRIRIRRLMAVATLFMRALIAIVIAALYIRSFAVTDMFARESLGAEGAVVEHYCCFSGEGLVTFLYRTVTPKDWVFRPEVEDLRSAGNQRWVAHHWWRLSTGVTASRLTWAPAPTGVLSRAGFQLLCLRDPTPNPYETTYWPIESPWTRVVGVTIPYWFLLLIACATLAPQLWRAARSFSHRKRRKHGQCIRCGYDVRVTPDRCPECGFVLEQEKAVNDHVERERW